MRAVLAPMLLLLGCVNGFLVPCSCRILMQCHFFAKVREVFSVMFHALKAWRYSVACVCQLPFGRSLFLSLHGVSHSICRLSCIVVCWMDLEGV